MDIPVCGSASHPGKGWGKGAAAVRAGLALPSRSSAPHAPPRTGGGPGGAAPGPGSCCRISTGGCGTGRAPGDDPTARSWKEKAGIAHPRVNSASRQEGTEGTREQVARGEPWGREWLLSPVFFSRNNPPPILGDFHTWRVSTSVQGWPFGGAPPEPPTPLHLYPINPEAEALRGSPCVAQGRSLLGGPPRALGGPRPLPPAWFGCEAGIVSRAPGRNKSCPEGGSALPGMSPGWFSRQEIPGKGPGDTGLGCPCVPTGLGRVPHPVSRHEEVKGAVNGI